MKIGLISDTHGSIPAPVFETFHNVSHIIHAGDIGNENVVIELRTIAPLTAVYGNVDPFPLVQQFPAKTSLSLDGLDIHIVHNISTIQQYSYIMFRENVKADLVVYGHTHRADCETFKHTIFCNPGSATHPRYGKKASVAILDTKQPTPVPEIIYFP